jgi:hypothetical protein
MVNPTRAFLFGATSAVWRRFIDIELFRPGGELVAKSLHWRVADMLELQYYQISFARFDELVFYKIKTKALKQDGLFRPNVFPHRVYEVFFHASETTRLAI